MNATKTASALEIGDVIIGIRTGRKREQEIRGRVTALPQPEYGTIGGGPRGGQYRLINPEGAIGVELAGGRSVILDRRTTVLVHVEEEW